MARKPFDMSASKPAEVPADFSNLLILFPDFNDEDNFSALSGSLLLTTEDEEGSDYVFGYVINKPLPQRLGTILKAEGLVSVETLLFRQMLDASGLEKDVFGGDVITFITRNNGGLNLVNEFTFGEFTGYSCESLEEVLQIAEYLTSNRQEFIVSDSIFFIEREQLSNLFQARIVKFREANADIVLNQSAYMRTELAFPGKTGPRI